MLQIEWCGRRRVGRARGRLLDSGVFDTRDVRSASLGPAEAGRYLRPSTVVVSAFLGGPVTVRLKPDTTYEGPTHRGAPTYKPDTTKSVREVRVLSDHRCAGLHKDVLAFRTARQARRPVRRRNRSAAKNYICL